MLRLVQRFAVAINFVYNSLQFIHHHVMCGKNTSINGRINIYGGGKILIGNNCRINSGKVFNPIGGDTRTVFYCLDNGSVNIGSNVGISNSTFVSRSEGIVIEDDVLIGGSCKIYDSDFHAITYEERVQAGDQKVLSKIVLVKKGAFIGAHCILLKGSCIGENSVIGAGSVVAGKVPDNEIWAGNPAKFIRKV